MRTALLAALLVLTAVMNGAWLSRVPLAAVPDLSLLVVLSVALRWGVEAGALAGAVAGYLRDLLSGSPLGLHVLALLVVGAAAGASSPLVDVQQRSAPAVAGAMGTMLAALLVGLIIAVTGVAPVDWLALAGQGAVAAAGAVLLAPLVDRVVRGIDRVTQRRYEGRLIGGRPAR